MGLKEDLKVDLLDLATDAAMQPGLYYQWAEKYAKAHSKKVAIRERARVERIRLKQDFDTARAKIEADIRAHWDDYSTEKKTEAGVMAMQALHEKTLRANEEYLQGMTVLENELAQATEEDAMMEAAKEAMEQRRSSIQVASQLYLGGYFSAVNNSKPAKEVPKTTQQRAGLKTRTD